MIAEQGAVRERLAQVAQGGLECRIVDKCHREPRTGSG